MKPNAKRAVVGVCIAVVFCCSHSLANAQPTNPTNPPPGQPNSEPTSQPTVKPVAKPTPAPVPTPVPVPKTKTVDPADAKALALYREGEIAYAGGKYASAALKFRAAYELSGRPQLLFNMANSYQQMGRYSEAAENLNNYVSHAAPKERPRIRSRIAVLRQMAKDKRAHAASDAQLRFQIRAHDAERNSGKQWAYATWAVGGFALMVGAVFAERSNHAAEDALRDCAVGPAGRVCLGSAQSRFDDEKRHAAVADVSFSLGFVAIAAGVYLYLRAQGRERRAKRAGQLRVRTSARGMNVGFQF